MLRIVFFSCVLAGSAATAQAQTPMQLNQSGKWPEAALLAERMLQQSDTLSLSTRCETRYALAYAYSMTGRQATGASEITRVQQECASLTGHWVLREAARLADELDPNRVIRATKRPDDGWKVGDPLSLKLDTIALAEHQRMCEQSGADACLVAYRGQIVQEWYGRAYVEPAYSMSSVKSWTALLATLLVADGKLKFDDPVAKWIPEWRAGAAAGVTVRQLLTMTSGLAQRSPQTQQTVGAVSDKNAFVFGLTLDHRPGERWSYSNEGVQLLSPILERAAGMTLERYARERLFEPLRMRDTELRLDRAGNPWTYADASTTLRDFAKVCQLALDRGQAFGKQIVPAALMDTLVTPIAQNRNYGFLWWLDANPTIYATRGTHNTDCYAMPELGLVVARIQGRARPDATVLYGSETSVTPTVKEVYRRIVAPTYASNSYP